MKEIVTELGKLASVVVKILLLIILIAFAFNFFGSAEAGDRIRFYDSSKDWARPTYGFADEQPDGSYRIYDDKNRYKGRVTRDRFISKDGDVLQKYYLLNHRKE